MLTTILYSRRAVIIYHPFAAQKTGSKRLSNFPKVVEWVSNSSVVAPAITRRNEEVRKVD